MKICLHTRPYNEINNKVNLKDFILRKLLRKLQNSLIFGMEMLHI